MSEQPKPTTMSETARAAAKLVAAEQMKRPGKRVTVVAIADGYDGFKFRPQYGAAGDPAHPDRFAAWWLQKPNPKFVSDEAKRPKDYDPKTPEYLEGQYLRPSWQMEAAEYDKQLRAAAKAELEAGVE